MEKHKMKVKRKLITPFDFNRTATSRKHGLIHAQVQVYSVLITDSISTTKGTQQCFEQSANRLLL